MDEEPVIFSNWGLEIFRRAERLYMRYDEGEIASSYIEKEISERDADKAQKSEQDAFEVIVAHKNDKGQPYLFKNDKNEQ